MQCCKPGCECEASFTCCIAGQAHELCEGCAMLVQMAADLARDMIESAKTKTEVSQ